MQLVDGWVDACTLPKSGSPRAGAVGVKEGKMVLFGRICDLLLRHSRLRRRGSRHRRRRRKGRRRRRNLRPPCWVDVSSLAPAAELHGGEVGIGR